MPPFACEFRGSLSAHEKQFPSGLNRTLRAPPCMEEQHYAENDEHQSDQPRNLRNVHPVRSLKVTRYCCGSSGIRYRSIPPHEG